MKSIPHADLTTEGGRDRCTRLTHNARCNQVIEAAIGLFAHKGFEGTKTKEIAETAGVNEALIFRDFQSKEKLYCAILEYASKRINAERWIEELSVYANRRNDRALFSGLARKFFESFSRERNLYRLMLYSALEQHKLARKFRERQIEPIERFIEDYMRTRQAEGAFRKTDPHTSARNLLNMTYHHVQRRVLFGDTTEPSDADAAQALTEVFLYGVRSVERIDGRAE